MINSPSSHDTSSLEHELDVGEHTLLLLADGSMELSHNEDSIPDGPAPSYALHLDPDETYRVFIALCEQFASPPQGG